MAIFTILALILGALAVFGAVALFPQMKTLKEEMGQLRGIFSEVSSKDQRGSLASVARKVIRAHHHTKLLSSRGALKLTPMGMQC